MNPERPAPSAGETRPIASLTVFFPAFNDAGTIGSMVISAVGAARKVVADFEVVVVNDGSSDNTAEILNQLASLYAPFVRVIHHEKNRGYGAALRTGFGEASKEWLFYTDGDAQYDPRELEILVTALRPEVDVVNGFKIARRDPLHRIIIGQIYNYTVKLLFGIRLKDVDCDFRLIRRSLFDRIPLRSSTGTICVEMVKKFQDFGCRFAEVPVHHYHRAYGRSQFFNFRRLWKTGVDLLRLWVELVVRREHLRRREKDAAESVGDL
ncbi:MAG: glycosyltransferase family 2 protein [Acidobacteria bacterium]|nr:MAG: glycosyltransferase family 2 protein [Acidobacteriota bacterium]